MVYNILVDVVVRATLELVYGPQEARHGMGWAAGKQNLIFYADNGSIVGKNKIWVQEALTVSVSMFLRMGLEKNQEKTKKLVWTLRYIWEDWSETDHKRKDTRDG